MPGTTLEDSVYDDVMDKTTQTPPAHQKSWQRWVGLMARLILGVTLIVAGLLKVTAVDSSIAAVRTYRIVSWDFAKVVGTAMPVVEIIVGLAILVGLLTRWSALLGALAMVAFIAGIASVWARGISLDCGCFGGGGLRPDPWPTVGHGYIKDIVRDTGLFLCGLWLVINPRTALSLDGWMSAPAAAMPPEKPATPERASQQQNSVVDGR